jgi:glyoxylase-like metal-dependent hydrolase (beta-lactamase superfamily II)
MSAAPEIEALSSSLHIWHSYDPKVKADLFSSAVGTADGVYLVDPIPLQRGVLDVFIAHRPVAGIIVTNANHFRAAARFSEILKAPVWTNAPADAEARLSRTEKLGDGDRCGSDLRILEIPGAAPGEIAIFCEGEGGVMIMGDALIHFDPYGFDFLPDKYCTDPVEMRHSLRRLLEYRFTRMLFAHGTPLMESAEARLRNLLQHDE